MLVIVTIVWVVLVVLYVPIKYGNNIKDFIRGIILSNKLPQVPGKRLLIGHMGIIWNLSKRQAWDLLDELSRSSRPSLYVIGLGPLLSFHLVRDPDILEACISSLTNLEKAFAYKFTQQWLENGLLISTGNHWKVRRKILNPAFHLTILQHFVGTLTRETSKMVEEIRENHLNEETDITHLISTFALANMAETSMGTKLDTKSRAGIRYIEAIQEISDIFYERVMTPWFHPQIIFDLLPLGRKTSKLVNSMKTFTNKIIRTKEENFEVFEDDEVDDGLKRRYPLLDILLNAKIRDNAIDEKGIRGEVNTFMFEGYETTSWALMYTIMLLACHKEIQNDVYNEIIQVLGSDSIREPTYADLQEMSLIERCIKESLRLYPSVSLIGRKLSTDVKTKYGLLPKGAEVGFQIYHIHRNEKYWPNPNKFDPSRFLPDNSRGRHPFAYVPFSAGPRNCIGQKFAMLEMKAAVCGIVRNFILEPVDTPDTLMLIQDILLRTTNGIKVKFLPRE